MTTSLNERSWVAGTRKDSRRHPRPCCDASNVLEAISSPLTAMSSRCSQIATRRALAWSKTLTSWVPSNEMLGMYVFKAGSKGFSASGSTRDRVDGAAREVVFCNHADHLVPKAPSIVRQNLRMQMPDGFPCHTTPRWWLLPPMLRKPHDGGEPPLSILEGKGKCQPHLPSPQLGTGMFQVSGLSEFCFRTSLSLFGPRSAISRSACLHRSRCVGVRGARDGSLCHRGLLCRSLLGGSCGRHSGRLARASYWAFSSGIRVLVGLAGLWLRPLG